MERYYLKILPACAKDYVWDIIKDCALQASWSAYQAIVSEPHVYFALADEQIKDIDITHTILEGGFFKQVWECDTGGFEGIFSYLTKHANAVMFAEDLSAMEEAGITTVYPADFESEADPTKLFFQLTAQPSPRNIFDITNSIQLVGWFLGILALCEPSPDSKEIVRCTYEDILARKPVFEGLAISSFDAEGYLFLVKKTCFDAVFAGHEFFSHGVEWDSYYGGGK